MERTLEELFDIQKEKARALHDLEHQMLHGRFLNKNLRELHRQANLEMQKAIANVREALNRQLSNKSEF